MSDPKLPVHGFVLAGGKSSRMGRDKALLEIHGRPMVQIAVEKLQSFCAEVWISGNRDDLSGFAKIVQEQRIDAGPVAGIEAGLHTARQPWALFVPVDVPLVPRELLQRWAADVVRNGERGLAVSYLQISGDQPSFCMLRRELSCLLTEVLDGGERKLTQVFDRMKAGGGLQRAHGVSELYNIEEYPSCEEIDRWFLNVNTPEELLTAEQLLTERHTPASGE